MEVVDLECCGVVRRLLVIYLYLWIIFIYIFILSQYTFFFFFFQADDGIRDRTVTGVQTCALPISTSSSITASTKWPAPGMCGDPKRSSTVTSALSSATTSVCGNVASPSPSDQCKTMIGLSTTTPAGTLMNAPPARNASCRTVNASGEACEHVPSTAATSASSHVARPQTTTPLATSVSSSSWCTTRPLRTTTRPARSPASAATGPPPGAGSGPGSPRSSRDGGRKRSRSSSSIRLYRQISSV